MDLDGRTAFITGGSSGIGLGIARACLGAGMKVAFTWRRAAHRDEALAELGADPARVLALELDVTDRHGFTRVADEVERAFGPVHLLVCNAGIGIRAGAAEATVNDWDWGLGVNLGGVVNAVTTFLPRLRANAPSANGQRAHLVATASTSGLVAGGRTGVYTTAKFAVVGMMESLREELEPESIGVSVFCPGFVRSNLLETERLRPAALVDDLAKPSTTPPTAAEEAMLRKFMAVAMDPFEAGQRLLDGVRRNDLYILTHPEFAAAIRERGEALLASVPDGTAPSARAALARRQLTDLYARERDRRREPR
ncbi:MAG TPA: SDR family NAD(P)-dependent oxidoreductase [Steroidobacteraceae bacterium]|nr:SDR family NAD(P)-dependent oxidoreductase [Steroidobacteraceae bacterium]